MTTQSLKAREVPGRFLEWAVVACVSGPDFEGSPISRTYQQHLHEGREYIARLGKRKGASEYLALFEREIDAAERSWASGDAASGQLAMGRLLNLIREHLRRPSKRELAWAAKKHGVGA
jgi:hypothetical protein